MAETIATRLRNWAVVAALMALSWLAIESARAARAIATAARKADSVAASVPGIIDRRVEEVIARADARAASLERTVAVRLASLERTADSRLASVERRLDARMGEALAVADRRLGEAVASVDRVAARSDALLASADGLVRRSDNVVADFHNNIVPWIDCGTGVMGEGKPCLQQEVWWMAKKANLAATSITLASETMSDTLRAYGPSTARSVDGIAASLDRMGKWYTSKRRLFVEGGLTLAGAALRGGF